MSRLSSILIPASEPPLHLSAIVPITAGSRVFLATAVNPNEQYVNPPASSVYNNLTALTYAAWVKITANNVSGAVMVKDPTGAYVGFVAGTTGTQAQVPYTTSGAVAITVVDVPVAGVWAHMAMTWDNAGDKKVHLYKDGVEVSYVGGFQSVGVGTPKDDSATGFYFGDDTFDNAFDGSIAEAVVYNTALTAPQVAALAASTTGATAVLPGNIVGYWHLCGITSPEPDASGNGNSGVLSANAPTTSAGSPGYTTCGQLGPSAIQTIGKNRIFAINADQDISILFGNAAGPTITPTSSNYRVPANQQTVLDTGAAYDSFKIINNGASTANVYVQLLSVS